jgi:hypothetical protein
MTNNPYIYDPTTPHTPVTPRPITQASSPMSNNQEITMPTSTKTEKTKGQQAIELYLAYPDTTPSEMAELLGVTEGAARTWKSRATGKLPIRGEHNKYKAVRAYILEHPKAPTWRIAKMCQCSETYVHALLNPKTGAIAAEFGDIRKNHIKKRVLPMELTIPHVIYDEESDNGVKAARKGTVIKKDAGIVAPIPLSDPSNKYARMGYEQETRRDMIKLLSKEDFTRADLKQLAVMLVMLDGMVKE